MADIEYQTPQDVADKKMMAAERRAYEAAKRIGSRDDNADKKAQAERMKRQEMYPAPTPSVDQMGNQTSMKKGGSVSSASSRADGIAQRGKTRGVMVMCGGGMTKYK